MEEKQLENISRKLRETILTSIYDSGAGHIGSSLSWADIGTVLFFHQMNLEGKHKDRFILSKGHAVPTLYSLLAMRGHLDSGLLKTLRKIHSSLEGHPTVGTHPMIYASTGALGQGLSMAIGYSFANKVRGNKGRVYVLLGDGECQEGQVWEAVMSGATLVSEGKISGLIAIVDYNGVQGDNTIANTMPSFHPLADKWKSFGWYVQEIDGHDISQICRAYNNADKTKDRPPVIIARTKKGSGVSFMEADPVKWHGGSLTPELYRIAMDELRGKDE